jgi:hypothetical protein
MTIVQDSIWQICEDTGRPPTINVRAFAAETQEKAHQQEDGRSNTRDRE